MAKINIAAILILALFSGAAFAENASGGGQCAYFFYGTGCPHCARVEPYLAPMAANGSEIVKFEVYSNKTSLALLNSFFNAYNVPQESRGVPVAFTRGSYMVGDAEIIANLPAALAASQGRGCPSLESAGNSTGIAGDSSPSEELGELSLITIISAALVDSINPCAIAVLIILMGALLSAGDRHRALLAGLAFTLAVYISYLLLGLGLFSAIQMSGLAYFVYRGIGILAIIIGLANLKDFFWYGGGGFVMEIPRSWRPMLKGMLNKATSPLGAFAMGFIVCLFELPCTGGPYLFILGLLAEKSTWLAAVPILMLYNVFFVIPLVAITLMIYCGLTNIEKADKWKERNLRLLHLVAGVVMTALGLLVALGIV
ncbi:MAG: cytochrome c biogenesis protein CcdA [Candidatus Micrarchaeia archaeon]